MFAGIVNRPSNSSCPPLFPHCHACCSCRAAVTQALAAAISPARRQRYLEAFSSFAPAYVAEETFKSYSSAWAKFEEWLSGKDPLTASSFDTAAYMAALLQQGLRNGTGPQAVHKASAAIRFFFAQANLASPTDGALHASLVKSADRVMQGTKLRRQQLQPSQLRDIMMFHLVDRVASLQTRMHLTAWLLTLVGVMRFGDLAGVLVHEDLLIFVHDTRGRVQGMLLFVPRSKTDACGEGAWVPVGATHGVLCPVKLVQELLQEGAYVRKPEAGVDCGPLLRAVRREPRRGQKLSRVTAFLPQLVPTLSHQALLSSVKKLAVEAGVTDHFGLHSGRSGGATAATMAGVDSRMVTQLGRWKHQTTMDARYVRDVQADPSRYFAITAKIWPF